VIKAYVAGSPAPFNLSADNIIHMQGVGVSSAVTSEMLGHDKRLSDQMAAAPQPAPLGQSSTSPYPNPYPQGQDQPVAPPQNTVSTYTIPADTSSYYSDLQPYGNWSYLANYGWCWQPGLGLGYAYYPWGILNCGRWWNCPGRGWVWFPRSGYGYGYRGTAGFAGGSRGFTAAGRVGGGFAAVGASSGGLRSSVSVRSIGGGAHFSGGHSFSFGGGHSSGGHSFGGFHGGHR
jgi:hypothetical protein